MLGNESNKIQCPVLWKGKVIFVYRVIKPADFYLLSFSPKFNSLILTGTKTCPSCLDAKKKGHYYPALFAYLGFLNDDDELVFGQIFQAF